MKLFPVIALLLLLQVVDLPAQSKQPGFNQRLYDTIPNLPEHYANRLAQFRKEPVVTGKTIFLGNSITEGANWQQLLNDATVINRGIGGDNTFGLLHRLDEIMIRQPKRLFILIGINDLSKDIPLPVIVANYRTIIRRIKSGSKVTTIYVQSVLPLNNTIQGFPQHYDKADQVIRLNQLLQQMATTEKVAFINLYPHFLDKQGRLQAALTGDGLHLNAKGYAVWGKLIR